MLLGEVTVTPEPSAFAHDGWALDALEAIGAPEALGALDPLVPHPAIAKMAITPTAVSPLRTSIDISPGRHIAHDATKTQERC